jgi:hypothetical protein
VSVPTVTFPTSFVRELSAKLGKVSAFVEASPLSDVDDGQPRMSALGALHEVIGSLNAMGGDPPHVHVWRSFATMEGEGGFHCACGAETPIDQCLTCEEEFPHAEMVRAVGLGLGRRCQSCDESERQRP